ncbi:MAG: hypothetical protein AMXMBFR84_50740 [Candidatus Hydrogenedentota bacterium]
MQTQRLSLVSLTREELIAEVEAINSEDRHRLSADWLALLRGSTGADPWIHGFTLVFRETGITVGRCGFKGPPAPDGVVEIAYGIEAAQQGKGYATEAVMALVTFAFESGRVGQVRAHTLPMENPSTSVLAKCGFKRVGEIVDPEDGLVWRWAKSSEGIARSGSLNR